ncbi:MAG TPA: c-type cytochrome, partial [Acidobacteriaceae bacterium]|nr:c-type cytochrome [Acidobacteriaceae bacterium]
MTAWAATIVGMRGTPVQAATPSGAFFQVETEPAGTKGASKIGAAVYAKNCSICHGDHREGNPPAFPPLTGIRHMMTPQQIAQLVRTGKGRMPAFTALPDQQLQALVTWLSQPEGPAAATELAANANSSSRAQAGAALFRQNCAFCHGRDAMGGEDGPDLTQSKLVLADRGGDKISPVVLQGRPGTKMPAFHFSAPEIQEIADFLHARIDDASLHPGKRRGVAVADLQTGNAAAGKSYFNGAGGCAACHSPTGDLAGVAARYQGLQLEERMLYPRDARSKVKVTLPSGETISGTLAYLDEFTVGLRDSSGQYRSWQTSRVRYQVDSPVDAHAELLSK